jgi:hypothetical protein
MKKILAIGIFMTLSACVNMQVTNSDFSADQAGEIARSCPAAAQAAANARQEANRAAAEIASATEANNLLKPMLEYRNQLEQELQAFRRKYEDAQKILARTDKGSPATAKSENELTACRAMQACFNIDAGKEGSAAEFFIDWIPGQQVSYCRTGGQTPPMFFNLSGLDREYAQCDCKSWLECKNRADAIENSVSDATIAKATSDSVEAQYFIAVRQAQLGHLNKKIADLEQRVAHGLSGARTSETNANAAYEEAKKISAEQCGEGTALKGAPAEPNSASGGYSQDVFNSQSMGIGANPSRPTGPVCPESCISIQSMCNVLTYCTGSPGDSLCLRCAACSAQGC